MRASWLSRFFPATTDTGAAAGLLSETGLIRRLDEGLSVRRFQGAGALAQASAYVLDGHRAAVSLTAGELASQLGGQSLGPGQPLSLVLDLVPGLEPGAAGDGLARAIARLRSLDIPVLAVSEPSELLPLALLARRLSEELLRPVALVRDLSADGDGYHSLAAPLCGSADWQALLDWVGLPADSLACVLPAQKVVFGATRHRLPRLLDGSHPRGVAVRPDGRSATRAGLYHTGLDAAGREDHIRTLENELARLGGWNFLSGPTALRGALLVTRGILAGRCRRLLAQGAVKELSLLALHRLHPLPASCQPAALPQPLAVLDDEDPALALPASLVGHAKVQVVCHSGGGSLAAGDLLALSRALADGREGRLFLGLQPAGAHPGSPREELRVQTLADAWPALDSQRLNTAAVPAPAGQALSICLLAGSSAPFAGVMQPFLENLVLPGGMATARRLAPAGGDRGLVLWRIDWCDPGTGSLPDSEGPADLVVLLDERAARELPARLLGRTTPLVFRLAADHKKGQRPEARLTPAATDHNGPLLALVATGEDALELAGGLLAAALSVLGLTPEGELKQALRNSNVLQAGFDSLVTLDPALCFLRKPDTLPGQAHTYLADLPGRPSATAAPLDDPLLPALLDAQADAPVDPLALSGLLPSRSGRLRREHRRPDLPRLAPALCTSCGDCWSLCPEGALPLRLLEPSDLLNTVLASAREAGSSLKRLESQQRALQGRLAADMARQGSEHDARTVITGSLDALLAEQPDDGLRAEIRTAQSQLANLSLVHWSRKSGVLLSIGVDADACKGCSLCARACAPGALEMAPWHQVCDRAGQEWNAFQALGATRRELLPDLAACREHPEDLLLDGDATEAFGPGDESPAGNTGRSTLRIWAGMAQALRTHAEAGRAGELESLAARLREKLQLELSPRISDPGALKALLDRHTGDLELGGLLGRAGVDVATLGPEKLGRLAGLASDLEQWHSDHGAGAGGRHARLALCLPGRGLDLSWPWNPSALPTVILDPTLLADQALGLADALAVEHSQRIRLLRMAALTLNNRYLPAVHGPAFRDFGPDQLTDEEWASCAPLLLAVDASALGGGSLQAWRRLLGGPVPVKLLVLCDAGDSDALALSALSPRPLPAFSGSHADLVHLREGIREVLETPGPAVATVYCSHRPLAARAGGDTASALDMARLAFAHGLWPHYRFNPAWGAGPHESLLLHPDQPAAATPVELRDPPAGYELESPFTLAHLRALELEWPEPFREYDVIRGEGGRETLPLAEYLELDSADRAGNVPLVRVGEGGRTRILVPADTVVRACEALGERWTQLLDLARRDLRPVDAEALREEGRRAGESTLLAALSRSLVELATAPDDNGGAL